MRLFSIVGAAPLHRRSVRTQGTPVVEGATLEVIAAPETLREGWNRVHANKGGPGGDDVTIAQFGQKLEANLNELSRLLMTERYRPGALKRVAIPKSDGRTRLLLIPAIVDRVVQSAMLRALSPTLDPRMSEASWAYRPGRGVKDALDQVEGAYSDGFVWTVDADITKYFDRVPHSRLIDELTIWIDDERLISLISLWLRGFGRRGIGIAQGSPISPLLANLYLHPIDRRLAASGYALVRYADDLVILTKTAADAKKALALLKSLLQARGLSLNGLKTSIRAPDEAFRFLGKQIRAATTER